ncbi:unnamed protein product [Moneuplotes crassus]|uniref:Uncharacterized protein n=1 Tax=Euplotes crassus TaxID=5936 RepID=A0AAD1XUG7_EUPCR|nr:unnamed protein product [Moneuplotes crassus]
MDKLYRKNKKATIYTRKFEDNNETSMLNEVISLSIKSLLSVGCIAKSLIHFNFLLINNCPEPSLEYLTKFTQSDFKINSKSPGSKVSAHKGNSSTGEYKLRTTLQSPLDKKTKDPEISIRDGNITLSDNSYTINTIKQSSKNSNKRALLPRLPQELQRNFEKPHRRKNSFITNLKESATKIGNYRFMSPSPNLTTPNNQSLIHPRSKSIFDGYKGKSSDKLKGRYRTKSKPNNSLNPSYAFRPEFIVTKKQKVNKVNLKRFENKQEDKLHKNRVSINCQSHRLASITPKMSKKLQISPKIREMSQLRGLKSPSLANKFENIHLNTRFGSTKRRKATPYINPALKEKLITKGKESILQANLEQKANVLNLSHQLLKQKTDEHLLKHIRDRRNQSTQPIRKAEEICLHQKNLNFIINPDVLLSPEVKERPQENHVTPNPSIKCGSPSKNPLIKDQKHDINMENFKTSLSNLKISPDNRYKNKRKILIPRPITKISTKTGKFSKESWKIPTESPVKSNLSPVKSTKTACKITKNREIGIPNFSKDSAIKDIVNKLQSSKNITSFYNTNDTSMNGERLLKGIGSQQIDINASLRPESNEQEVIINKQKSSNIVHFKALGESKNSYIQSLMSPYSSTNKESQPNQGSCKAPSFKKTIDSLMLTNNVVNEADESFHEDDLLRESSKIINDKQEFSFDQPKLSDSYEDCKREKHKGRYSETSQNESCHNSDLNLLSDTFLKIDKDFSPKLKLIQKPKLDFSKEVTLPDKPKNYINLQEDQDDVLQSDNEVEILPSPIKKPIKKSFDSIPLRIIPQEDSKASPEKKIELEDFDDSIIITNDQVDSDPTEKYSRSPLSAHNMLGNEFETSLTKNRDNPSVDNLKLLDQETCEEPSQRCPTPEAELAFTPRQVFFLNQEKQLGILP